MSAELLREAAELMREDGGAFEALVANWLVMTADHMDPEVALDGGCPDCEQDGALAVARAYLGTDDQPIPYTPTDKATA
jgi:hypothetical protein